MRDVIAVDPGKTTGLVRYRDGAVQALELPCWKAVRRVEVWLIEANANIVCEAYVVGPHTLRKSRQYWSLESIGALRYLALRYDVPFTLQAPADAKSFVTDDRLRNLNWYRPTPDGHANDANRHLALYLIRNNWMSIQSLRGKGES